MSPLLMALLLVLLVPLFVGTWRTSLLGLALQGFVMGWLAYRTEAPSTISQWLTLADLVLLRALLAPYVLYRVLRARNTPARHDVIPPNLLSWTLALGSALLAFNFAQVLVPAAGLQQSIVAVATVSVMLGFLVLATQDSTFSQMIGALRIENGIALLELGGDRHVESLGLQAGQMLVVAVTILLYGWYLETLDERDDGAPSRADDGPEVTL